MATRYSVSRFVRSHLRSGKIMNPSVGDGSSNKIWSSSVTWSKILRTLKGPYQPLFMPSRFSTKTNHWVREGGNESI
jgi:hypothetical protein